MPRPRTTVRRVTVSLQQPDLENLKFIATCTGLSENDSIRKAIATEAFVQEQLLLGSKILAQDGQAGDIRYVEFVG